MYVRMYACLVKRARLYTCPPNLSWEDEANSRHGNAPNIAFNSSYYFALSYLKVVTLRDWKCVLLHTHQKKKKKKPNIKNSFTQFKYQLLRTNELTIPLPISMARVASVVLPGTKMCFITNSSIPVINWQSILG